MTLEMVLVLARLKELHALMRVRRAIAASAFDPDWAYVLAAIDEQLHRLRTLLEQDDPQVIRDAEDRLDTEQLTAPPALADRDVRGRVH